MAPARYTPRDFGLRSDSFQVIEKTSISPRVVCALMAKQKDGKTFFALDDVPDPIVYQNFDQGLEGTIDMVMAKNPKKIVIVAGMPIKDERTKYPSYHFARPVPERGKGRHDEGYLSRVRQGARPYWERFISDHREALEGNEVRTIVVDTGGAAFNLGKFAFHGMDKVTQKDDPYGQKGGELKAIFQGIVADGLNYDKNVIWIHRTKEIWSGGQPSGKMGLDGYNQMGYEVQVTMYLKAVRRRGVIVDRVVEIIDNRLPGAQEGDEFTGKQATFRRVAAALTNTDLDEWY